MLKVELIQRYYSINRGLMLTIIAILILFSLAMWFLGVDLKDRASVIFGAVLLLGAVIVFQLPRISFVVWKRRYHSELKEYPLLVTSWSHFRDELARQG